LSNPCTYPIQITFLQKNSSIKYGFINQITLLFRTIYIDNSVFTWSDKLCMFGEFQSHNQYLAFIFLNHYHHNTKYICLSKINLCYLLINLSPPIYLNIKYNNTRFYCFTLCRLNHFISSSFLSYSDISEISHESKLSAFNTFILLSYI